jgi:hypothetical protein
MEERKLLLLGEKIGKSCKASRMLKTLVWLSGKAIHQNMVPEKRKLFLTTFFTAGFGLRDARCFPQR